jgi:hypothetical protein
VVDVGQLESTVKQDIPENLQWAWEDGRTVQTLGGGGVTSRRRLADLVLPTGRVALGLPGDGMVNQPSTVQPEVPPGRYPVTVSLARAPEGYVSVAFVVVEVAPGIPVAWEPAGGFFTDSGDGCLYDASLATLLTEAQERLGWQAWYERKCAVLQDGDGSVPLDPTTGANAIVFDTYDWFYPCFIGKDEVGCTLALVVDCRLPAEGSTTD